MSISGFGKKGRKVKMTTQQRIVELEAREEQKANKEIYSYLDEDPAARKAYVSEVQNKTTKY